MPQTTEYQNIQCWSNPMGDKPPGCTVVTEQLKHEPLMHFQEKMFYAHVAHEQSAKTK